ncbi:hypothetical protein CPB83DRAFT_635148 [Crepidotus variabilis]|uniref:Uncharacterized protein n=1 Tax=Crepidotus variabilis TaxID=179855 RepID=A0A9P6JU83_9AGAR|nr:hypothetical protein CPB83DRAFT_635148 [Crepidotus variabilis]
MDNSMQGAHPVNHHTHVFDPQLTQVSHTVVDAAQASASSGPTLHPDGTPIKRRPGRPKGSTKKNLLAGEVISHKVKRPVGRPRKDGLPAGSVGPSRVKREVAPGPHHGLPVPYPGVSLPNYPGLPYGYPMGAPGPPAGLPPPNNFHYDLTLPEGENDWVDLAKTNPDAFLNTLLTAIAAPNPLSSTGPSVEEAFKSHLGSLATNPQQQSPIPSLFSIMKTFWLPSSPSYFALTASASTKIPSEHRFLYWDPQPLVFNGIACPNCGLILLNKGRITSGPIKVYDVEKPFFVVGCEYVCRSQSCVQATTAEGRKFASTDPAILRSLPSRLKDEFPARLIHGDNDVGSGPGVWNWRAMGVSNSLWNLVMGCLRAGLRKEMILGLVWGVQHGVPDLAADDRQPPPMSTPAGPSQPQQNGHVPNHEADKMDEDPDEDDLEDDEPNQTQTLSSTNFSATLSAAWKDNSTTTQPPAATVEKPTSTPAPVATPVPTPASGQATPSSSAQPTVVAQTVPTTLVPGYNPYTAYPFTPYTYMPHTIVNGQMVPIPGPSSSAQPSNPMVSAETTPSISAGPSNATAGTPGQGTPNSKRSPRHCCKCGSQECKGKGGRSFCLNACQDCGKLECKGRNSRRPDKKCSEGWQ